MKVMQINVVYKTGSTGKITYDLHHGLLDAGIESFVLYGRGEIINEPNVTKICSEFYAHINKVRGKLTGLMYGGCFFSTHRIIKEIKKQKPDIVHLQCINGDFVNIYKLITWLKNNHISVVLTLHAEFMFTANCGHAFHCNKWKTGCGQCPSLKKELGVWLLDHTHQSWEKMKKAFDNFNHLKIVSVSPWLMERAKQSPILADKSQEVVLNGLDDSVFYYYGAGEFKKSLGLTDKKVVFHATPYFTDDLDANKGGHYIIELAREMPNVAFVIAGPYKQNMNVPANIMLLGPVTNQKDMAKYYSLADVTVIASQRETFSMVVAESLCCGTPVVGFLAGGPESITIPEYSQFVEYGNVEKLLSAVRNFINLGKKDEQKISDAAVYKYSVKAMVSKYIAIYHSLINEKDYH